MRVAALLERLSRIFIRENDDRLSHAVACKAFVILSAATAWKIWFLQSGGAWTDQNATPRLAAALLMMGLATWIHARLPRLRWVGGLFVALSLPLVGLIASSRLSVAVFAFGRNNPLVDAQLAAIDASLGFDWPSVLRWWVAQPALAPIAQAAYSSLQTQLLLVPLVLGLTAQPVRVSVLVTAMTIGLIVISLVAMAFPAYGAYEYFGIVATDHAGLALTFAAKMTEPIQTLRAGAFDWSHPLPIGLISMPSFHSAAAVYCAWGAWRLPRPLALAVVGWNALMLFATPLHGSHYLCDCVAGVLIAVLTLAAAKLALLAPWRVPAPVGVWRPITAASA